ncbi:hypothetical protein GCM10022403_084270 [Streptomyces coacervatus]|uniref:Uncharacterized protein n=1 Tax=Streptomyces coacervatus TaxID=647381 RepID=A0ABP7JBN9_9ACTN|nr:hypothetical protein [Streptomyces coacervatus]MDF2273357.1 hypothetical protein [Streptomyces coacervatus]
MNFVRTYKADSLNIARSDDRRILKAHPFRLSVTWSDGYFAAAALPALTEAGFAQTPTEAVNQASGPELAGGPGQPVAVIERPTS